MEAMQKIESIKTEVDQSIAVLWPDFEVIDSFTELGIDEKWQRFDEAFEASISKLVRLQAHTLEMMTLDVDGLLARYSTNSGLLKSGVPEVAEAILKGVKQLVAGLDKSVLLFSDIYQPLRDDLLRTARRPLNVANRKSSEETGEIGLYLGGMMGLGVGGVGGAFIGAVVGELAGSLVGESMDKLHKRVVHRANHNIEQVGRKTLDFIYSQRINIKRSIISKSDCIWPEPHNERMSH